MTAVVVPADVTGAPRVSSCIFLVAGEVSGDMQAAHLVAELRGRDPTLPVRGVGGPHMAQAGVSLFLESSTWGVIGYVDPFLRLRAYFRWLRQVELEIRRVQPAVLILVDFPGFNLRLAARVRKMVPIVYYFPPMVSVRRGNRAQRIAALGMRLLAVLPPEAEAYRTAGADVVFVGHPAVDLVRPRWDASTARAQFGIPPDSPVVALLPGSRRREVRTHLPILLEAAGTLRRRAPDLWFILPVPTDDIRRHVERTIVGTTLPLRVVSEIYDAMAIARVAVTATGSATLEAAILGVPMVAVYRTSPLNWFIVWRLLKTSYLALPNILARREVVPELLQARMTPQAIVSAVDRLLQDTATWAQTRSALLAVAAKLGPPGALARAADEVWRMLTAGGRFAPGDTGTLR